MSKSKKHGKNVVSAPQKQEYDGGRRMLIFGLLAGGAALVVGPAVYYIYSSLSQPTQSTVLTPTQKAPATATPQTGAIRFEDVKAGLYTPEKYIAYVKQSSPAIRDALRKGELIDVLYNPSRRDLELSMERIYTDKRFSRSSLEEGVQNSLDKWSEKDKEENPFIMPGLPYSLFGEKMPMPITIFPSAFRTPVINADADFRSILDQHELKHVQRWHYGGDFNGLRIASSELVNGELTEKFFVSLEEALAYNKELTHIVRSEIIPRKRVFSPRYVVAVVNGYSLNYFSVSSHSPTTQLEQRVKELALNQLGNLRPEVIGKDMYVHYSIDGVSDTLRLVRRE